MQIALSTTSLLRLLMLALLAGILAACGPIAATPTPMATPTGETPPTATTPAEATNTAPAVETPTAPAVAATNTSAPSPSPSPAPATGTTVATQPTATAAAATATAQPTGTAAATPQPTVTTPAASPTGEPQAPGAGRVIYLDADGSAIKSIDPGGGEPQTIFTVAMRGNESVGDLKASPNGEHVLYGISGNRGFFATRYSLVRGGEATPLEVSFAYPRWSPDGTRFAAQALDAEGALGPIYIYDVARGNGGELPVSGAAGWFPDGRRIVYASGANVFTYDLTGGANTQVTNLPDDENNRWVIQHAHVLPGGEQIVFFGGAEIVDGVRQFGPHGEGQRWWSVPVAGGEPRPWVELDPGANAGLDFVVAPGGELAAFSQSSWAGALCGSEQKVAVVDVDSPATAPLLSPMTGLSAEGTQTTYVRGISWSPAGDRLAYAVQPTDCTPEGPTPPGPPTIYLWQINSTSAGDAQAQKLVDGSYPQWVAGASR